MKLTTLTIASLVITIIVLSNSANAADECNMAGRTFNRNACKGATIVLDADPCAKEHGGVYDNFTSIKYVWGVPGKGNKKSISITAEKSGKVSVKVKGARAGEPKLETIRETNFIIKVYDDTRLLEVSKPELRSGAVTVKAPKDFEGPSGSIVYKWYDNTDKPVGTGDLFTPSTRNSKDAHYYATAQNEYGCTIVSPIQPAKASAPPEKGNPIPPSEVYKESGKTPFSLTIAGGISLGAYEAGLNWALLKGRKGINYSYKGTSKEYELDAVTGASAGNVNALMSAVHWCADDVENSESLPNELTDNLFWNMWIPIGMDVLFPGKRDFDEYRDAFKNSHKGVLKNGDSDLPSSMKGIGKKGQYPAYEGKPEGADIGSDIDGLLTRKATSYITEKLTEILANKDEKYSFKSPCNLTLGTTLTKAISEKVILSAANRSEGKVLQTQKYVLSLKGKTEYDKMVFSNQTISEPNPPKFDANSDKNPDKKITSSGIQLILRRSNNAEDVELESIIQAVKASASFPVAFSPASVVHCTNDWTKCFSEPFVDGGAFDNIPIGLAAMQVNEEKRPENYEFYFIDPVTRRGQMKEFTQLPVNKESRSLMKFWWPFLEDYITSVADTELIATSFRYKGLESRTEISDRFAPLAGDHLSHFGAFFDRPFREYDYYVGVYDAMVLISQDICKRDPDCLADIFPKIAGNLNLSAYPDAGYVVKKLIEEEEGKKEEGKKVLAKNHWAMHEPMQALKLPNEPVNTNIKIILEALFKGENDFIKCKDIKDISDKCENTFTNFLKELYEHKYKETNPVPRKTAQRNNNSCEPNAADCYRQERILKEAMVKPYGEVDPSAGIKLLGRDFVDRLDYVERKDKSALGEEVGDGARFLMRSLTWRDEIMIRAKVGGGLERLELDPSLVPDCLFRDIFTKCIDNKPENGGNDYKWGEIISHLAPYRAAFNTKRGGVGFTWEPTFTLAGVGADTTLEKYFDHVSIRFPLEWQGYFSDEQGRSNDLLGGAIANFEVGNIFIPRIGFGPVYSRSSAVNGPDNKLGMRIQLSLIEPGFLFLSWTSRDMDWENKTFNDNYLMVGVENFNALLYWAGTIFRSGEVP